MKNELVENERMRKIVASRDIKDRLKTIFGVVEETIIRALNYKTDTELSRKIRVLALQLGAKVVSDIEMKIISDERYIVQSYGNQVKIVVEKKSCTATLVRENEEVDTKTNATAKDLLLLQQRANLLALSIGKP